MIRPISASPDICAIEMALAHLYHLTDAGYVERRQEGDRIAYYAVSTHSDI